MRIVMAEVLGMCFGVRDALAVLDDIDRPGEVTIHGELVHNEKVLEGLHKRGFQMVSEQRRVSLPMTDTVLVTAHGISQKERSRLEQAGKKLIDTTCPLVTRAHQAAQKLKDEGRHVIVIGKPGHVEVQGIIEDLDSVDVAASPEDARCYPFQKLGIMCQTTTPVAHAEQVRRAIAKQNPRADIKFIDTICHPTKDHQKALEKLLDEVEAVVVVGGRNSNNTKQLVISCRERGLAAFHVQDASDLRPEWFAEYETIGLTAGTSTPEKIIDQVQRRLRAFSRQPSLV